MGLRSYLFHQALIRFFFVPTDVRGENILSTCFCALHSLLFPQADLSPSTVENLGNSFLLPHFICLLQSYLYSMQCPHIFFSTSIMKATELNDIGSTLLEQGDLEAAALALKEALKATRDVLGEKVITSNETSLDPRYELSQTDARPSSRNAWIPDGVLPDGSPFLVYRSPESISRESRTTSMTLNGISASILFNLSLTHHLRAMSSPIPALYDTSLKLYEHTYRLIAQDENTDHFLALAVLNNVAHIQYKLHNPEEAERTCGLLWGAVLEMEQRETKMSWMVDAFCKNVVQATFKHSQAAPAA